MSTLITNIAELTTHDEESHASSAGVIHNAAIVFERGIVAWVGRSRDAPAANTRVDAGGRAAVPGWVDSHTHLVFAGDRSAEFSARMAGETYRAGGIHTTVAATRAATDAQLTDTVRRLRREALFGGTTTLETKTGYGLTLEDELRSAQIASQQVDAVTFLGAHIVPLGGGESGRSTSSL